MDDWWWFIMIKKSLYMSILSTLTDRLKIDVYANYQERAGLIFSGKDENNVRMEIVELSRG